MNYMFLAFDVDDCLRYRDREGEHHISGYATLFPFLTSGAFCFRRTVQRTCAAQQLKELEPILGR